MFTKSPATALVSLTCGDGKQYRLLPGQRYRLVGGLVYQEWQFLSRTAGSETRISGTEATTMGLQLVAGRSFRYSGLKVQNEVDEVGRRRVGFLDVWERMDGRVGVAFRKGWSDGWSVYEDRPI